MHCSRRHNAFPSRKKDGLMKVTRLGPVCAEHEVLVVLLPFERGG